MKLTILLPILLAVVAAFYLGYSTPLVAREVSFQAPAITENGEGTLAEFTLWLRPGNGRILVNIDNAFYREDSENSLRKAKAIAERYVGLKLNSYDLIAEVEGGERIVGGESAGMLFSAGIVAAFTSKKIRSDAIGSAAISESGMLVEIDGVEEKIRASAQAGKKYFVIASEQKINREEELAQLIQIIRVENAGQAIGLLLS